MMDTIRIMGLLLASILCGILGLLFFFGERDSIITTVAFKPAGAVLLAVSCLLFDQLKRESGKFNDKH